MAEDSDPFNIFDPDTRGLVSPSRAGMLPQENSLAAVVASQPAAEVESQDTDKAPTSTTPATSREIAAVELQPAQEPSTSTSPCSPEAVNLDASAATSPGASVAEFASDQPRLEQQLDASPPHSTQICDINTSTTMASTTTPINAAADEPTQDLIASPPHSAQVCDADAPPTMSLDASVTKVTSTPPRPEASPSHTPACDLDTSATMTQTTLPIDVATDEPTQDLIASSSHSAQACDMHTPPATTPGASVTEAAHDQGQARPGQKLNVPPSHSQACHSDTLATTALATLPIDVATDEPTQDLITSSSHSTQTCDMEAPPAIAPSSSPAETVVDEPRSNSSPLGNFDQTLALDTTSLAEAAVSECSSVQEPQTPTSHTTNTTQNDGTADKNTSPATSHSTSPLNKSTDDEASVAPEAAAPTHSHSKQASISASPRTATATTSEPAITDGVVSLGCDRPPPGPFHDLIEGKFARQDYYPKDNLLKLLDTRERFSNTLRLKEEKQIEFNGKPWQESWGLFMLSLVGIQISYEIKVAAVEDLIDQMKTPNWSEDRTMGELEGMHEKLDHMITLSKEEALMKRTVIEYANAQHTIKMHMHFKNENKLFNDIQRKDFFEDKWLPMLPPILDDLNNLRTIADSYRFANKTSTDYAAAQQKIQYWIEFRENENMVINSKKNPKHTPGVVHARNPDCLGELADKPHETIYHSTGTQTRHIMKPAAFKKVYGRELSDAESLKRLCSIGHPDHVDHSKLYYGEPFVKDSPCNDAQPKTCDSGFQTMDYDYRVANILMAKSKAKNAASKLNKMCLEQKNGLHVSAKTSKDTTTHSQQYKFPVTIHRDGSAEHTTSFTPEIQNIVYETGKTKAPEKSEKVQKITSHSSSPPTSRFEHDQKNYPQLFEQGWPKLHFPVDDTGAYSKNINLEYGFKAWGRARAPVAQKTTSAQPKGTPTLGTSSVGKKRGRETEAPTSDKRPKLSGADMVPSAKPSGKRKRDDESGQEAKVELATPSTPSKRPRRLPPMEKTLTVFSLGGEKPAKKTAATPAPAPAPRAPAAPTPTRAPATTPAAAPAPAPAPAPGPAPAPRRGAAPPPPPTPTPAPTHASTSSAPARPARAPRKPTANRGEVRAGYQPYDARAAGRRHNRR